MLGDNESGIFIKAAKKIIDIYNENKDNEELKEMLENERNVIDKWSKIFNLDNIDNTKDEVFNFFSKSENHHWDIQRKKNDIDLEQFKEGLKILLDDSKDVGERLKDATDKVNNFGNAMATAILLVHNVEKYGVWNKTSQNALDHLGLWKWGNGNKMEYYSNINETLIKLRDKVRKIYSDTDFDLWKLDAVLYMMIKGKTKEDDEMSKVSRWWVEKSSDLNHDNIQGIENAKFGESLLSPQTDDIGRYIYENMTNIEPNDLIIHLDHITNSFVAISKAASTYKEVTMIYSGRPVKGYQVELKEYKKLEKPLKWDEMKEKHKEKLMEILKNKKEGGLFYNINLQLNQIGYITEAPIEFVKLLNEIYKSSTGNPLPYFDDNSLNINVGNSEIPNKMFQHNIILHGPVGTGKTYISNVLAQKIVDNEISTINDIEETIRNPISYMNPWDEKYQKTIKRITFHKSYSYEDFIAGIKAVTENGTILYRVEDGIFKEFCDEAKNNPGQKYIFIIDEINRGDISRIFGELITLIEEDKRDKPISLPFKRDGEALNFLVPSNLYIIGTMNDSDRNIALIDVALRRRFTFFRIGSDEDRLSEWLKVLGDEISNKIKEFVKYLNKQIKSRIGQDYEIGHAFFAPLNDSNSGDAKDKIYTIFKYKIFPLLEEYFHSDREALTKFLGEFYGFEPIGENDRIPIIEPLKFKNFDELMNLIDKTLKKRQST